MINRQPHYIIEKGYIAMWDGDGGYIPIARVINDQHCDILVRTLEFAEECEECIDIHADAKFFQERFSRYTRDIMLIRRKDDCYG